VELPDAVLNHELNIAYAQRGVAQLDLPAAEARYQRIKTAGDGPATAELKAVHVQHRERVTQVRTMQAATEEARAAAQQIGHNAGDRVSIETQISRLGALSGRRKADLREHLADLQAHDEELKDRIVAPATGPPRSWHNSAPPNNNNAYWTQPKRTAATCPSSGPRPPGATPKQSAGPPPPPSNGSAPTALRQTSAGTPSTPRSSTAPTSPTPAPTNAAPSPTKPNSSNRRKTTTPSTTPPGNWQPPTAPSYDIEC